MPTPRTRRIVRRAEWMLLLVPLLPVWYVGGIGGFHWLLGRGLVTTRQYDALRWTVFVPLYKYRAAELPGGQIATRFNEWCFLRGKGIEEIPLSAVIKPIQRVPPSERVPVSVGTNVK